jgi:uncharacterized membrane protein YjjB (DUF3815 family)
MVCVSFDQGGAIRRNDLFEARHPTGAGKVRGKTLFQHADRDIGRGGCARGSPEKRDQRAILSCDALGPELQSPSRFCPVPLFYDVIAAGVAVAAYGTFFSVPWRMLPIPMLIGMLAHAARWLVVAGAGFRIELGAFVACLIVSVIVAPIVERLRLPFAGLAFASVVSLVPGVFLFQMGGGLLTLVALGAKGPAGLLQDVIVDGATAFVVVLAMAFGLIIPKLCIDRIRRASN